MIPYQQLRNEPRIDLASSMPLHAPLALFLEPTNVCNFRCPVCPESLSDYRSQAGYYQSMPEKIWRKVYSDLWARVKVLRFYDEGEPMLNKDLPAMIAAAAFNHLAERLEVTTNGSLLDWDRCVELVASGVDYVRVSVYGTTAAEYQKATGSRLTPDDIIRGVRCLRAARRARGNVQPELDQRPFIYAHLVSAYPDAETFRAQYGEIADDCGVEPHLHNWGGNDDRLVQLGKRPEPAKRVCSKPFYEMTVKANGDVSACCADWSGKLYLGNVMRESLLDIWNGQKLRAIQAAHLAGERERLSPCNGCTLIYNQTDDLDRLVGVK